MAFLMSWIRPFALSWRGPDPSRFSFENLKAMQRVAIETPTPISTMSEGAREAVASPSVMPPKYNLKKYNLNEHLKNVRSVKGNSLLLVKESRSSDFSVCKTITGS